MTPGEGRLRKRRANAVDRHFARLYLRIDELSSRVGRLERAMWIATGSLGAVAGFNLITNLTGG